MGDAVVRQLFDRKSVRAFADTEVPEGVRRTVLEAACQAPTAGNQQLYTIVDVRDAAVKERLAVLCDDQPFIAAAPMVLVFLADCRLWPRLFSEAGVDDVRDPGVGDLLLAVSDATICAQNAVCAAWAMGLGSCYIGDVMERAEDVRELLSLPPCVFPAAMLVLGYPTARQASRPKPGRAPLSCKVVRDRYRDLSAEELRSLVADRDGARGFEEWARAFCARKYESDFSREMTRSVGVYLADFDGAAGPRPH